MIEGKINSSDKVLRYMSFEKFMDMVCRAKLYVSRADSFDDGFEGNYTQLVYEISKGITVTSNGTTSNQGIINNTKEIKESAFISCWTLSESESMALWKLYGGKNSIAIETTVGSLDTELCTQNNNNLIDLLNKRIAKVDYIDHKSRDEGLARELLTSRRAPLMKKAKAYSYEQEIRIIIDHLDHHLPDLKERLGAGLDVEINIKRLINKIFVSPLADIWFFNLLKRILKYHGMSDLVLWSNMRSTPIDEVFTK